MLLLVASTLKAVCTHANSMEYTHTSTCIHKLNKRAKLERRGIKEGWREGGRGGRGGRGGGRGRVSSEIDEHRSMCASRMTCRGLPVHFPCNTALFELHYVFGKCSSLV